MLHTRDFYIWSDNRWLGVDQWGLIDYLIRPGWKKVILGRTIPDDEYNALYQRVKSARDFGRKHGYLPGERKQ